MFLREQDKDTICACITPPGIGGVSVLRLSGENSRSILGSYCSFLPKNLESHKVYYGYLSDVENNDVDEVLVTYFHKGRSFTGDETFEISCHGSNVIVSKILNLFISAGARTADRGEFTYRAYMSGRIDLAQAESVLSLIESSSEKNSQLALRQLKGELSQRLLKIEDRFIWLLAQLEANIDYSAEDIVVETNESLIIETQFLLKSLEELMNTFQFGKRLKDGIYITLAGEPNVGKSSLLNLLLSEEKAIVTHVPGTTRDIVDGEVIIEGYKYIFRDTAGLRITKDIVEQIGINKTREALADSDLCFYVFDISNNFNKLNIDKELLGENTYFLLNKSDLLTPSEAQRKKEDFISILASFELSDVKNRVIETTNFTSDSKKQIFELLKQLFHINIAQNSVVIQNQRHFELLKKMQNSSSKALKSLKNNESSEFVAFEFQDALLAMHELLGKEFDDQVMDRVFNEFCIGK